MAEMQRLMSALTLTDDYEAVLAELVNHVLFRVLLLTLSFLFAIFAGLNMFHRDIVSRARDT